MDYLKIVKLFKTSELVSLYNRCSASPVRKFVDRKTAEVRCAGKLAECSYELKHFLESACLCEDSKAKLERALSKASPEEKQKPEKSAPKKLSSPANVSKGKSKIIDCKIYKTVDESPYQKKGRRHACWLIISDGMTVRDFLSKGGIMSDLQTGLKLNHYRIDG